MKGICAMVTTITLVNLMSNPTIRCDEPLTYAQRYKGLMKSGPKSVAGCDLRKMDRCAEIVMVFGRRDVYLPVNEAEMKPHCQVIKNRCGPKGTKEYLSHYPCIHRTMPHLHNCMDQLVVSLEQIRTRPSNDRIPSACCSFSRYIQCSSKPIQQECKDDVTAVDYVAVKMIKGYASEVMDLACQGYQFGGDKCSKVTLPDGGFKETDYMLTQYGNATDRATSLIPPFIDIFTEQ